MRGPINLKIIGSNEVEEKINNSFLKYSLPFNVECISQESLLESSPSSLDTNRGNYEIYFLDLKNDDLQEKAKRTYDLASQISLKTSKRAAIVAIVSENDQNVDMYRNALLEGKIHDFLYLVDEKKLPISTDSSPILINQGRVLLQIDKLIKNNLIKNPLTVAIIGAGTVGVGTATRLAHQADRDDSFSKIAIFSKRGAKDQKIYDKIIDSIGAGQERVIGLKSLTEIADGHPDFGHYDVVIVADGVHLKAGDYDMKDRGQLNIEICRKSREIVTADLKAIKKAQGLIIIESNIPDVYIKYDTEYLGRDPRKVTSINSDLARGRTVHLKLLRNTNHPHGHFEIGKKPINTSDIQGMTFKGTHGGGLFWYGRCNYCRIFAVRIRSKCHLSPKP